jgi:NitT/TauT family transport system substrate-binding protein
MSRIRGSATNRLARGVTRNEQGDRKMRSRKSALLAAALAVCATLATACGGSGAGATGSEGARKATVYLGFPVDGVYAPAYVAQKMGYYKDAGLDITIAPGQGSTDALRVVSAGRADFGFSDALTMAKADADGGDLRMIATVMPVPPEATLVKGDSPIKTPADLKGKTLGDSQDSTGHALLPALLAQAGLTPKDVKFVKMNFASRVPALLAGKIDATEGYATEFPAATDQGRMILWRDFGLDYYGEGLYATNKFLDSKTNQETAKKFVQATMKGLDYSIAHPDETAKILASAAQQSDPTYFQKELTALIPIWQAHDAQGLGYMTDAKWTSTLDLVTKYLSPKGSTTIDKLYTNEYLR